MKPFFTVILFVICGSLFSQVIPPPKRTATADGGPALTNPSFEDIARASLPPRGWIDCGFPNESAPDVQPSGAWEVYRPAHHGYTYLGMVTRENDTWESVGQRLSDPLLKDLCYSFSVYLCTSSEYWSAVVPDSVKDRETATKLPEKNFNQPIKLRIWGGDSYCDKKQLLAESKTVDNHTWEKYAFKIEPNRDWTHVVLEAFYKTPTLFPYNGNILLDHCSDFEVTPCGEDTDVVRAPAVRILQPIEKINTRVNSVRVNAAIRNVRSKSQIDFQVNGITIHKFEFSPKTEAFSTILMLKEGKNSIELKATNAAGVAMDETSVYIIQKGPKPEETTAEPPQEKEKPVAISRPEKPTYKVLKSLNRSNIISGEIIRVDRLYFAADSAHLSSDSSYVALDEIFQYLQENKNVVIEVGGHTSGGTVRHAINARFSLKLSRARAKSVATYLVRKGISAQRILFKGYGSSKPIANNNTRDGRIKNQRVEIKILST